MKDYLYTFGTYDEVGIFYLPKALQQETGMKYVIGMEFRKDDTSVTVPTELPYVILPECDIVIKDVAYEYRLDEELLDEIIDYARGVKTYADEGYKYVRRDLYRHFVPRISCVLCMNLLR